MLPIHKSVGVQVVVDSHQFTIPTAVSGRQSQVTFLSSLAIPAKPPTLGCIEAHNRMIILFNGVAHITTLVIIFQSIVARMLEVEVVSELVHLDKKLGCVACAEYGFVPA
jgi:hypothetical protein